MEMTLRCLLALLPLALVLFLMIRRGWSAHLAGLAGWIACVVVARVGFGLTGQAWSVSQVKGLLLSAFVLAVMWPALMLYHWLDQTGGILAVARQFERAIPHHGMRLILLAWGLSGALEGIAGFGLPIAVVAPMLARLGVPPVTAVAAVAVGHAWAVTFGDMGVILQTLAAVVGLAVLKIVPWAALLLGAVCALCGLAAAQILGCLTQWRTVMALALVMGLTQYALAALGVVPLSALGGGLAGLLAYIAVVRLRRRTAAPPSESTPPQSRASDTVDHPPEAPAPPPQLATPVGSQAAPEASPFLAMATYGSLAALMMTIALVPAARTWAESITWRPWFPAVSAGAFVTPAGPGQVFRPLAHPGFLILLVTFGSIFLGNRADPFRATLRAAAATWRSAATPTVGILFMVGLSALMEHSGMSRLLAEGLSQSLGTAYPVMAPWVGILGAFATGSNNNSNVLFGPLQRDVAVQLGLRPELLAAAQTAGGSLGSMLAPAKIVVGCSTVGLVGQEGQVTRRTVPLGLGMGLIVGALVLLLCRVR
jgi:lactate permease